MGKKPHRSQKVKRPLVQPRPATLGQRVRELGQDIHGVDDSGREYSSLSELWLLQGQQRDKFYKVNENWWVKGYEGRVSLEGTMIGDEASQEDVQHSQDFLRKAVEGMLDDPCSALDCGAGIGRVTKAVLLPAVTGSVTLVDQSERWLQTAKSTWNTRQIDATSSSVDLKHTSRPAALT